jgi:hypothetical protein
MKTEDQSLEARRRACKKLGYTGGWFTALVFGKTTAAKLVGLTPTRLERLLEPCDYAANPYYKAGPAVGLYDPVALVRLMKRKSVKKAAVDISAKRELRREASRKATETKRRKAIEELEQDIAATDWTGPWPRSFKVLRECAIAAYNRLHSRNGKQASGAESAEFISRIAINYLRHERTDYDWLLEKFKGRVGINDIHDYLKDHVEFLARQMYPELTSQGLCVNVQQTENRCASDTQRYGSTELIAVVGP